MTPEQLTTIGLALYGRGWQTSLAFALDVKDRTIRRWVAGSVPIPGWLTDKLAELKKQRIAEIKSAQ